MGLTAQRAKTVLSCNHGNNPVRQGSWLHLAKEEEEEDGGVLAGTGAVTGPGLPSTKWESSPVGEIQTFPRVAERDPHAQRTFLPVPKAASRDSQLVLPHLPALCLSPVWVTFLVICPVSAVSILFILRDPFQVPPLRGSLSCLALVSAKAPRHVFIQCPALQLCVRLSSCLW